MILFAYNFPHRKTQDIILHCVLHNISIDCIIAADAVKLNIPSASIRTKLRNGKVINTIDLAKRFNIPFHVCKHNSQETLEVLGQYDCQVGIISGARILKDYIISVFEKGIINFHPGFIPEARGLDAMLWSIYTGVPLGVTAHLIDRKVDAGRLLKVYPIKIFKDDTLLDLSERLYLKQIEVLPEVYAMAEAGLGTELVYNNTSYFGKMPPEKEQEIAGLLPNYLQKFSS